MKLVNSQPLLSYNLFFLDDAGCFYTLSAYLLQRLYPFCYINISRNCFLQTISFPQTHMCIDAEIYCSLVFCSYRHYISLRDMMGSQAMVFEILPFIELGVIVRECTTYRPLASLLTFLRVKAIIFLFFSFFH